jgi:hypothetical protein
MIASEIWEYDNRKKQLADKYGYELITIWEGDFLDDPAKKIQECKEIIYERIKKINQEIDS